MNEGYWSAYVEQLAPDEDIAKALETIAAITARDRWVDWHDRKTDFIIVSDSFGEDYPRAARALRTLERRGEIVWEPTGRVRMAGPKPEMLLRTVIRSASDVPVYTDVREPAPETSPIEEPSSDGAVIHGPFGREPKPEPPTGVMLPSEASEHPWFVSNVHAPVLEAEEPPAATQPTLADAAQQVLDNLSNDEPF